MTPSTNSREFFVEICHLDEKMEAVLLKKKCELHYLSFKIVQRLAFGVNFSSVIYRYALHVRSPPRNV